MRCDAVVHELVRLDERQRTRRVVSGISYTLSAHVIGNRHGTASD